MHHICDLFCHLVCQLASLTTSPFLVKQADCSKLSHLYFSQHGSSYHWVWLSPKVGYFCSREVSVLAHSYVSSAQFKGGRVGIPLELNCKRKLRLVPWIGWTLTSAFLVRWGSAGPEPHFPSHVLFMCCFSLAEGFFWGKMYVFL